jgi:hypothetical protein
METLTERTGLKVELWLSFVSLLRSYAAASNLNRSHHARIEEANDFVAIAVAASRLEMHFASDTGQVRWRKQSESAGPVAGTFDFLPEGAISVDGATQDLDRVAIEFVQLATTPGSVSGHDFSRAENDAKKMGASAPEGLPNKGERA